MKLTILVIIIIIFAIFLMSKNIGAKNEMDLEVKIEELYPKNGSTLETNEAIFVGLNYKYKNPAEDLYIWAKVLDETYDSMYQGSIDKLTPGTGRVERYVYLTEPGHIKKIHIVVKTMDFKEIYNEFIEVDFKFEASDEYKALKDDGTGSKITDITFDKPIPATLKVGERVTANLEYDINTDNGLDMWVMPETECSNSYEGTTNKETGKGHIQKYFVMGEPCELKKIKLMMKNVVSNTVYEKIIDVDFKFE